MKRACVARTVTIARRRSSTEELLVRMKLEDSNADERRAALDALAKLEPAALALHADAIVRKLEDSNEGMRRAALWPDHSSDHSDSPDHLRDKSRP